jgi:glycosyltransferase involved in cell wall biosynthesis
VLSVVMPAFNEQEYLADAVSAVVDGLRRRTGRRQ